MPEWRLLFRVAGEETSRYFRGFNRRVLLFIVLAGVVGGLLVPILLDRGITPDERIYRAQVFPGSPLEGALQADRRFEVEAGYDTCLAAQTGDRGAMADVDLCILGSRVSYMPTERGRAALRDFAEFAQRYFDVVLVDESNQTAAFPVKVNVVYQARQLTAAQLVEGQTGPGPTGVSNYTQTNESYVLQQSGEKQLELIPGRVEAPFPMESLLLTFVYLVPLNFVGQYYAGSLLGERTRSRGVLLLSAPLTGPQILFAKSLPYIAFGALFSAVATTFLDAGALAFLATLPIFGFFLAATCFAALLARSYRELTFFVTTMSVALSTYLFLPAIFTQVHPIAYISPISVVAAGIRGEAVPFLSFLYSITPLTLAALVLGGLSTAIYREETLFAPRGVLAKGLDAIHFLLARRWHFLLGGALVLPFVFGVELLVLAFAASFPLRTAVGLFLVGVATVEELAKALPAVAHFRRATTTRSPTLIGILVGTGFFLGEKLGLLFSLVGLDLIPLGDTLLTSYGITTSFFLILGPWVLHVVTATLTAHAARLGGFATLGGILGAILVHVGYNWWVIQAAT